MPSDDPGRGIEDRMADLRGEPETGRRVRRAATRDQRPGGVPGWVGVGALAILAAGGVYLFDNFQNTQRPGLLRSTTDEFQDGRPTGSITIPGFGRPRSALVVNRTAVGWIARVVGVFIGLLLVGCRDG